LESRLRMLAKEDSRTRLLMTTPGVGAIVALTFSRQLTIPPGSSSPKAWARILV
jgi:hypothetical protein